MTVIRPDEPERWTLEGLHSITNPLILEGRVLDSGERVEVVAVEDPEIKMIDISSSVVELEIRHDGKVVWLNVNGATVARISRIEELHINDSREPAHE